LSLSGLVAFSDFAFAVFAEDLGFALGAGFFLLGVSMSSLSDVMTVGFLDAAVFLDLGLPSALLWTTVFFRGGETSSSSLSITIDFRFEEPFEVAGVEVDCDVYGIVVSLRAVISKWVPTLRDFAWESFLYHSRL
jgi:hypothetical protein